MGFWTEGFAAGIFPKSGFLKPIFSKTTWALENLKGYQNSIQQVFKKPILRPEKLNGFFRTKNLLGFPKAHRGFGVMR